MLLVTASEIQAMDRETIENFGVPGIVLMESAGRGATRKLVQNCIGTAKVKVAIMAGRGNNGGDGFVIARYLSHQCIPVTVYLLSAKEKVKGDAAANLALLPKLRIPVIELPDIKSFQSYKDSMRQHDIWVDAILGTGLKSNVTGYFKFVIDYINDLEKTVFAVDIPSGLNSDTGQPCGCCIRADATATFAYAKIGHVVYPGAAYTGDLNIVDIGIPPHIAEKVDPKQHLLTRDDMHHTINRRDPDAHKGKTGHALVIAGSTGKTGAAAMTSMSAMRVGAGLVTLGVPDSLNAIVETQVLEAMTAPLPETGDGILGASAEQTILDLSTGKKCVAIGPGLGQADETRQLLLRLLPQINVPTVIDADGVNNLSGNAEILKTCQCPLVLTPHPGEMAHLLATSVQDVQADRIACARNFATEFKVNLVLKGARTVVAHPDGHVFINPTGNAGMASGGMGDILTGIIAGLIAQGYSPEEAARLGVYLHGAAADTLAETKAPFGYLASDVMYTIPFQLQQLLNS